MSQMMTVEIPFQTADDIKKVLGHFGLKYEEATDGLEVRGLHGVMSRQKGNIVIRKEMFGGMADMAFLLQEDGSWKMHGESADQNFLTQMQNAHLYLKVEAAAKRKQRKLTIEKGRVPTKLERYGARTDELVLSVEV